MRRHWRDRFWLWKHRKHGRITSWGVEADGSQGEPYWTCSCDPHRRHYPRGNFIRVKKED